MKDRQIIGLCLIIPAAIAIFLFAYLTNGGSL